MRRDHARAAAASTFASTERARVRGDRARGRRPLRPRSPRGRARWQPSACGWAMRKRPARSASCAARGERYAFSVSGAARPFPGAASGAGTDASGAGASPGRRALHQQRGHRAIGAESAPGRKRLACAAACARCATSADLRADSGWSGFFAYAASRSASRVERDSPAGRFGIARDTWGARGPASARGARSARSRRGARSVRRRSPTLPALAALASRGRDAEVDVLDRRERDRLLQEPLDLGQVLHLDRVDERDRLAGRARAAGAADAVDVVLGNVRQLVVDDERQVVDVEAARGDVGGDEHLELRVLERGERLEARRLGLVAVDRRGDQAVLLELAGEARRAVLGAHEAEHLLQAARADDVLEQRALAVLRALVRALHDGLGRGVAARDLDQLRLVQERSASFLISVGERRREQQVLPLRGRGQQRHDALDVRDEAHVEHAVAPRRARRSRPGPGGRSSARCGRAAGPAWRRGSRRRRARSAAAA